jgi:hypothetical protein
MLKKFNFLSLIILVFCHTSFCQKIYRVHSFDGSKEWRVVAIGDSIDNRFLTYQLNLLSDDVTKHSVLDSISFGNNGCSFKFDTLNKRHVIKMRFETTGSGFYGKHLLISAIIGGRFQQLFHTYLATQDAFHPDSVIRILSNVEFKDVNNDGVVDIVEHTREDLIDPSEDINVFKAGELENAKLIHRLSTHRHYYFWNQSSMIYEESLHK